MNTNVPIGERGESWFQARGTNFAKSVAFLLGGWGVSRDQGEEANDPPKG